MSKNYTIKHFAAKDLPDLESFLNEKCGDGENRVISISSINGWLIVVLENDTPEEEPVVEVEDALAEVKKRVSRKKVTNG